MTKSGNIYEEFHGNLAKVAAEWPTEVMQLESEAGSTGAFEEVATLALNRTVAGSERLGRFDPRQSYGVQHGMEVAERFQYLSAYTALESGVEDIDDIEDVLRHDETIGELITIAKTPGDVAKEVEYEHGLTRSTFNASYARDVYKFENGRIRLTTMPGSILRHTMMYKAGDHYNPDKAVGCNAHLAQTLIPIYHEMVTINLKDPSLLPALVALRKEVAKTNNSDELAINADLY